MADTPRKRVNWLAVRTAYVVHGYTMDRCAEEFGVDRTTVAKRASREGWTAERHRNATEAGAAMSAAAREEIAAKIGAHAERVGRTLGAYDLLLEKIETAIKSLDMTRKDAFARLRGLIEMHTRLAESLGRTTDTDRLVRGILAGRPSDENAEQSDNAFEFTVDDEALEKARELAK